MDDSDSSFNWSQDEDETCFSSHDSNFMTTSEAGVCGVEGSTSNQARSNAIIHFSAMGFAEDLVIKIIDESGEENPDAILETLLAYTAPEECAPQDEPVYSYPNSPDMDWNTSDNLSEFSDADSCLQNELEPSPEMKMMQLVEMGYSTDIVSAAIDSCDPDTCVDELMDYISAAQMAETTSNLPTELPHGPPDVKRKKPAEEFGKRQRYSSPDEDEARIKIPKRMIGFGIPGCPRNGFKRRLPDEAVGPPYFYFENVALAPKHTWDTISDSLFKIEPEFVDSKHFCAAVRKRGYIHNLPTENRFPLLPIPPLTIQKALPHTSRWWPSWDTRSKLNCLLTVMGSATETDRVREHLEGCGTYPPETIRKLVLQICRKWNFVWTGYNRVAPLDPVEMELILGYPRYHTRGTSQTARYKALGNTFQVDTVAYHLSVLKNLFPNGISVLSLFSGIGGAEVALHRLGIRLNFVVAVEKCEENRYIFKGWWENTKQQGILIDDITDVTMLTTEKLQKLVEYYGGFDLIIGGSPCNNLSGSNRLHRDGLQGSHSVLFFEFCRILETVRGLMNPN